MLFGRYLVVLSAKRSQDDPEKVFGISAIVQVMVRAQNRRDYSEAIAEFRYMLSLHPRCSMREIKKSFNDKAYKTKLTLILKYIIATLYIFLYLITTTLHYYVIEKSYDVKVSETQSVLIYFQIAIKLQRNVRLSKFKLIYIL